jgi:predicted MFS family arabinose efflux permease
MASYLAVLRIKSAQALLISAFPGRLAYGMIALGIYFKVQHTTHSISIAGLAVGLNALSGALTAGLRAAAMDRWGLKWPLRIAVPAYGSLILLFNQGHSSKYLLILAFILGFTAPPINLSVRPMWKVTVRPDQIRIAYSLDTSVMNAVSVLGPLLATALALSKHPERALQLCSILMFLGGGLMLLLPATRSWKPETKQKGELAIWRTPAIRLLMLEGAVIGLGMGTFTIGIPAFTTIFNLQSRTGLIFAIMAGGAIFGGIFAGLISRKTSSLKAFRTIYIFWFIASLPLAFTFPDWRLMSVVAILGVINGAQHVFYWEITEAVRPRGSAVAALGWLWTVEGSFTAVGNTLGGYVSDHFSPRWCLASATVAIGVGLIIIWTGKNVLRAADCIPTPAEDTEAIGDVISAEK